MSSVDIQEKLHSLPKIETDRLVLRHVVSEDLTAFYEIFSDPEVTLYTPRTPLQSLSEAEELFERMFTLTKQRPISRWGIALKEDHTLIGLCGFISWEIRSRKAEVAYVLSRTWWNRGLMTEALQAVLAFGFATLQIHRIEALCEPQNLASAQVLKKCGFTFEGRLRDRVFDKGSFHTLDMYSILSHEFSSK
jgi:[ribosomal protein S5]-alanine N-acetyltransferase